MILALSLLALAAVLLFAGYLGRRLESLRLACEALEAENARWAEALPVRDRRSRPRGSADRRGAA